MGDTKRQSFQYFYKNQLRKATVTIVSAPGIPDHYWFDFNKGGQRYFKKVAGEWEMAGPPIDEALKQSLIEALTVQTM